MGPRKVNPKLVPETLAQGRIREIYDDIKRLFGVPHVNVIFQAYAASPKFLDVLWRTLRPAVETAEFFACADRLRASAVTIMHNYYPVPDLCARIKEMQFSEGAQNELTNLVQLFCYGDSLMLLFVATASRAMDSPVGTGQPGQPAERRAPVQERPVVLDDAQSPPATLRIFEDIRSTLGFAFVNSDYRALARWPDFLQQYWTALKPIVQSPLYPKHMADMRDAALSFAAELPGTYDLTVSRLEEAGLESEEAAEMARISDVFLDNLSGMALNIAVAKLSLEDGTTSINSRKQPQPSSNQPEPSSAAEHVA